MQLEGWPVPGFFWTPVDPVLKPLAASSPLQSLVPKVLKAFSRPEGRSSCASHPTPAEPVTGLQGLCRCAYPLGVGLQVPLCPQSLRPLATGLPCSLTMVGAPERGGGGGGLLGPSTAWDLQGTLLTETL